MEMISYSCNHSRLFRKENLFFWFTFYFNQQKINWEGSLVVSWRKGLTAGGRTWSCEIDELISTRCVSAVAMKSTYGDLQISEIYCMLIFEVMILFKDWYSSQP